MKKSLIISATALLLFVGCTEDKKETKAETTPKQEVVATVEQKAPEVKTEEKKVSEEIKKEEPKVVEIKQEVKEEKKPEEKTNDNSVVTTSSTNGEALFKTCASCHGTKGEKEALGKSQVIAGWDKDRVIKALNGYKDGSYGGVMKGIMKTHVDTKTPEEISALAEYISKL